MVVVVIVKRMFAKSAGKPRDYVSRRGAHMTVLIKNGFALSAREVESEWLSDVKSNLTDTTSHYRHCMAGSPHTIGPSRSTSIRNPDAQGMIRAFKHIPPEFTYVSPGRGGRRPSGWYHLSKLIPEDLRRASQCHSLMSICHYMWGLMTG